MFHVHLDTLLPLPCHSDRWTIEHARLGVEIPNFDGTHTYIDGWKVYVSNDATIEHDDHG